MLARVIKHVWTTSQKAEATAVPSIPQQPEPLTETVLPAVDVTVKTVGGASPDEAPAALHSQPSPIPEAGSLRRPTAELAPQTTTPEPPSSGRAGSEPKVSSDRCWTLRDPGSAQLTLTWLPPPPVYLPTSCCHAFLSLLLPCMSADHSAAQKMCVCVPTGPACMRVHVPECNQMISKGVIGGYGCSRSLSPLLIVSAWL